MSKVRSYLCPFLFPLRTLSIIVARFKSRWRLNRLSCRTRFFSSDFWRKDTRNKYLLSYSIVAHVTIRATINLFWTNFEYSKIYSNIQNLLPPVWQCEVGKKHGRMSTKKCEGNYVLWCAMKKEVSLRENYFLLVFYYVSVNFFFWMACNHWCEEL